jgi:O-antigen/teichoic acid export membrane protein
MSDGLNTVTGTRRGGQYRRIIRAIAEIFLSRALAGLLFALSLVLLARWSDAAEFGRIAALIGAAYFILALADFGLTQYMLRQTALGEAENLSAVRRALSISKYTSAAVLVVCLILGTAMGVPSITACLVATGIALDKYADNWQSVLIAERRTGVAGALVVCRRLVLLVCQVAGYVAGGGAGLVFGAGLTVAGLGTIGLRRRMIGHVLEGPFAGAGQVIRESRYYWLAVASSQARELDGVLVFAMAGPLQSGLYGAANRVVRPLLLLSVAAANVLLPELSRGGARRALRTARLVVLGGSASIALGLCVTPFAGRIVNTVLGHQYESAASTLAVLCVAVGPTGAASLLGGVLQSQGIDRTVGLTNLGSGVVAIAAVISGAHFGGSLGAAVAAAVCAIVKFYLLAVFCRVILTDSGKVEVGAC